MYLRNYFSSLNIIALVPRNVKKYHFSPKKPRCKNSFLTKLMRCGIIIKSAEVGVGELKLPFICNIFLKRYHEGVCFSAEESDIFFLLTEV